MKNTFGNNVSITIFGESHGVAIGAVLDGISPGIEINEEYISKKLAERRPTGDYSTPRKERDAYEIVSGVFGGYTTGTPICILIRNENTNSGDYESIKETPRPSHADYAATLKYHGFQDYRGGGHFSGRITAGLVAAGAILEYALMKKGVKILTHIKELHGIADRDFEDYEKDASILSESVFPALSDASKEKMIKEILSAKKEGDSVGGILETAIIGMPGGVGEPYFDSVESILSHALFSIPAVKGVEFGDGFKLATLYGSEANDPFAFEGDYNQVKTKTNRNGGINGGITNSMPVTFRCVIKPTPSIAKEQESVNLKTGEGVRLNINGRHDPAIIHRAMPVVDATVAIALADLLVGRFGTDYLKNDN